MTLPLASISLDLDNKWSYLKTHGDPRWESFPSYLELVVPRILEFLAARDLSITVFVVGQDAALPQHRDLLAAIAAAGHEIANHSFHHEPWLHLYSPDELRAELGRAEEAIAAATGARTVGFRGPGFSISQQVLNVLAERGYQYDASIFPTFLGPVARAYYFFKSRLSKQQRQERKALFGKFTDGLRPLRPFSWSTDCGELIELPVTTMPLVKTPIHLSYLVYLASFSTMASRMYLRFSLGLCRMLGIGPSILLHPLDFLGPEDERDLSFFPGMNVAAPRKLALIDEVISVMRKHHRLVTMREHAASAAEQNLRRRSIAAVRTGVA